MNGILCEVHWCRRTPITLCFFSHNFAGFALLRNPSKWFCPKVRLGCETKVDDRVRYLLGELGTIYNKAFLGVGRCRILQKSGWSQYHRGGDKGVSPLIYPQIICPPTYGTHDSTMLTYGRHVSMMLTWMRLRVESAVRWQSRKRKRLHLLHEACSDSSYTSLGGKGGANEVCSLNVSLHIYTYIYLVGAGN